MIARVQTSKDVQMEHPKEISNLPEQGHSHELRFTASVLSAHSEINSVLCLSVKQVKERFSLFSPTKSISVSTCNDALQLYNVKMMH